MNYKVKNNKGLFDKIFPWISSFLFLPLIVFYIINKGQFTFPDYVNLLIHEGGHGIFRVFGDFIYTAGGTIMQILIPLLFLIYYIFQRSKLGFQFSLFWIGESLMNIAPYAADARARVLPLLGGNKTYHDWTWMLSRLNMLDDDIFIGDCFYYAGVVCFIIVFTAPLIIKKKEETRNSIELDLP